jgi:putative membrane protein
LRLFYILRAVPQAGFLCRRFYFPGDLNRIGPVATLLLYWLSSAASLAIAAYVVPGIEIRSVGTALIAPLVIGFVNATLGVFLKVLTLPLTILTLGLFWIIINGLMLQIAAFLVPGFFVAGFGSALLGAILLSIINMVLRGLLL